jgi:hypothetical protein
MAVWIRSWARGVVVDVKGRRMLRVLRMVLSRMPMMAGRVGLLRGKCVCVDEEGRRTSR